MLYESFIHPLTIISSLPSAGAGALIALLALNFEFTLIALIGIILLVGIVKKNAIMMIDVALNSERNQGQNPETAIFDACVQRFRPIMMTVISSIVGFAPLLGASGAGAVSRWSLGTAIVGGLLVSTILSLLLVPNLYIVIKTLEKDFLEGGGSPPQKPSQSQSALSSPGASSSATAGEVLPTYKASPQEE
jgi:multidrug efflux pump